MSKKIVLYIICILVLLGIGFFIGRKTISNNVQEKTIYLPGDTVEFIINKPFPVEVVKPIDTLNIIAECIKSGKFYELFPERVKDSIVYVTKSDTSTVIFDWATIRKYDEIIFDNDTLGTATFKATVQYNRLSYFNADFSPKTKVVFEPSKIKKYSPFIGVGLSTKPSVLGQAGIFFDDKYGVSAIYQYDWNIKNSSVGMMFLRKF